MALRSRIRPIVIVVVLGSMGALNSAFGAIIAGKQCVKFLVSCGGLPDQFCAGSGAECRFCSGAPVDNPTWLCANKPNKICTTTSGTVACGNINVGTCVGSICQNSSTTQDPCNMLKCSASPPPPNDG